VKKQTRFAVLLLCSLLSVLVACRKPPVPPPAPIPVFELTVDKTEVATGETVVVRWVVPAGTQATLYPPGDIVEGSGEREYVVTTSQTFVLSGTVSGRQVETSVRVIVVR